MNLTIVLPFKIFARLEDVSEIVGKTVAGAFGLLPHRLDCVAALVPGILSYTTAQHGTHYLAIGAGVLIKSGDEVSIAVRGAVAGTSLDTLQQTVTRDYLTLDAHEREMRTVVGTMESGFFGRIEELRHER